MPRDSFEPIIITTTRRKRRKRRVRIGPWVLRTAAVTIALAGAGYVGSRAAQPYLQHSQQRRETQRMLQELAAARQEHQELLREVESLRAGRGLEVEARRIGYVRPGEVPLQVTYVAQRPG